MVSEKDRRTIIRIARRYGVSQVFLFGSSVESPAEARDIDLGGDGIVPERFFDFYADLLEGLDKPVDLIDLADGSSFSRLVVRDGVLIYGDSPENPRVLTFLFLMLICSSCRLRGGDMYRTRRREQDISRAAKSTLLPTEAAVSFTVSAI